MVIIEAKVTDQFIISSDPLSADRRRRLIINNKI